MTDLAQMLRDRAAAHGGDKLLEEAAAALEAAREDAWQPIETAPRDGSEVLVWRADCGILLARWTAPIDFMTTTELEAASDGNDDWMEEPDWFCADFVSGSRLDGTEAPTHWRPLPAPPAIDQARGKGVAE